MAENHVLEIRHLSKSFGKHVVLRDIDFTVDTGDVTCIIGASGSGKSTLLRCVNMLETPTTGEILYHEKDITDKGVNVPAYRSKVGMVFQSFNLFNNLTVLENCMIGQTKVLKRSKEEAKKNAMKYLEKVGMAPYINAKPKQISGGQKQRVAIARALAMEPEVLVLDEPTAGLDPAGRENLMANIRDYHRNKGKTIILVSHSMDEIARNVDRILVLKNAHVLMQGTPAEVFARGEELLSAGLDVPQITRIAMELKRRGVDIDPAVYTVEALERQLLALRKGGTGC